MWKLRDKWLTTNQKGQTVKEYIKELVGLGLQVGYENIGLEMCRDKFVSGLKRGMKESGGAYSNPVGFEGRKTKA